jgi:hypothetical protein
MRRILAAAAALVLASPAAAQPEPDPAQILLGALERAQQNVPAGVASYLVTLSYGPGLRAQLYVARREGRWEVVEQRPRSPAHLFGGMVIWPLLAEHLRAGMRADDVAQPPTRYLGEEAVGGRAAHVLMMRVSGLRLGEAALPDTVAVWVDADTRQVLRVRSSTRAEPSHDDAQRRRPRLDGELVLEGYEAINGVTLPRRWRIVVGVQMDLTDAERQQMHEQLSRMDLTGTAQEVAEIRMLNDLTRRVLDGQPMEVTATVEDVQVNPLRPVWAPARP